MDVINFYITSKQAKNLACLFVFVLCFVINDQAVFANSKSDYKNTSLAFTTDLSLTKITDNVFLRLKNDVICARKLKNKNTLYTTNIIVTDCAPVGLTYKNTSLSDFNTITLFPKTEVSINVTVNILDKTVNNTVDLIEEIDSTPNNNK